MFYKFSSDFDYDEKDWEQVLELESMIMSIFMEFGDEVIGFDELVRLTKTMMSEAGSNMPLLFLKLYFDIEKTCLVSYINENLPHRLERQTFLPKDVNLEVNHKKLQKCINTSREFREALQR